MTYMYIGPYLDVSNLTQDISVMITNHCCENSQCIDCYVQKSLNKNFCDVCGDSLVNLQQNIVSTKPFSWLFISHQEKWDPDTLAEVNVDSDTTVLILNRKFPDIFSIWQDTQSITDLPTAEKVTQSITLFEIKFQEYINTIKMHSNISELPVKFGCILYQ